MKLITAKAAGTEFLTEFFCQEIPVGRGVYSDEASEFVFLPFERVLFSKDELAEISTLLASATSEAAFRPTLPRHP